MKEVKKVLKEVGAFDLMLVSLFGIDVAGGTHHRQNYDVKMRTQHRDW